MQQFSYTIKDKDGVHARPAGVLIKAAKGYQSRITLETGGRSVDLKSGIFALMGLGIRCGAEVTVTVEGEDEAKAFVEMRELFGKTI